MHVTGEDQRPREPLVRGPAVAVVAEHRLEQRTSPAQLLLSELLALPSSDLVARIITELDRNAALELRPPPTCGRCGRVVWTGDCLLCAFPAVARSTGAAPHRAEPAAVGTSSRERLLADAAVALGRAEREVAAHLLAAVEDVGEGELTFRAGEGGEVGRQILGDLVEDDREAALSIEGVAVPRPTARSLGRRGRPRGVRCRSTSSGCCLLRSGRTTRCAARPGALTGCSSRPGTPRTRWRPISRCAWRWSTAWSDRPSSRRPRRRACSSSGPARPVASPTPVSAAPSPAQWAHAACPVVVVPARWEPGIDEAADCDRRR